LDETKTVNFGPQTKKLLTYILTNPSGHFSGDYISALSGCYALKFLHALEIDQGYLAHTPTRTGVPPKIFNRENLKFGLKFSVFGTIGDITTPIALKLCHMVGMWLYFIIPLQKFGGRSPQKNWGPKICKIFVNFGPLQNLIANISGTAEDIQSRLALQTMAIPSVFNEKSPVNFGSLTAWNYM